MQVQMQVLVMLPHQVLLLQSRQWQVQAPGSATATHSYSMSKISDPIAYAFA